MGFFIAIVLGIAIGFVDHVGSFLSLSRTFVFFPYFLLGFLLNGDQLKKVIRARYSLSVGIVIIIGTYVFFGFKFPQDAVPWLLGDTSYTNMGGEGLVDGLYRGLQYGLTLIVVFGFLALIPSNQFRVTKIGERTLYVYLLHGFIIKSLQVVLPNESIISISGNYLLLLVLSFVICIILGSYLIKKYTQPLVEFKV
jgi:fucose 4-O-acetylase-like acetyltransferase